MINHYEVLGFQTSNIGIMNLPKLTTNEISKAYKSKALDLHPDKRPNDPNANSEFQQLKFSYDILMDDKSRKTFDVHLHNKHAEEERASRVDKKGLGRKMTADLRKNKNKWQRRKYGERKCTQACKFKASEERMSAAMMGEIRKDKQRRRGRYWW